LRFADLFRERFMRLDVTLRLTAALDLGWATLAECFAPEELLMRESLVTKFYPGRG
jgi:V/A-type H+-transporting ATPase subunit B